MGPDVIVATGADDDLPRALRRRRVGVAGDVDRAHPERVRAGLERDRLGRAARLERRAVDASTRTSIRCAGVALSVPKNSNVASVSAVRPLGPATMPVPGGARVRGRRPGVGGPASGRRCPRTPGCRVREQRLERVDRAHLEPVRAGRQLEVGVRVVLEQVVRGSRTPPSRARWCCRPGTRTSAARAGSGRRCR